MERGIPRCRRAYFGVATRRRIYLSKLSTNAREILFEREGVCRFTPRASRGNICRILRERCSLSWIFDPGALSVGRHAWAESTFAFARYGHNQTAVAIENTDRRTLQAGEGRSGSTLAPRMGTGGMNVPLVMNRAFECAPMAATPCDRITRERFLRSAIARTLDANGGRPDCKHGSIAVVAFCQTAECGACLGCRRGIREYGNEQQTTRCNAA
jgi:hypothetical protein